MARPLTSTWFGLRKLPTTASTAPRPSAMPSVRFVRYQGGAERSLTEHTLGEAGTLSRWLRRNSEAAWSWPIGVLPCRAGLDM
jgi:hypothetical protein